VGCPDLGLWGRNILRFVKNIPKWSTKDYKSQKHGYDCGSRFMIIKEKTVNGLPILCLNGKLDIFSKNNFRETAEKYRETGGKGLILDFEGITFVDSVGLGTLTLVAKTFQKLKGRVILVNPQEQVKSMFVEMNVGKIVPMYKTDESYSQFSAI
jgi:anti-anti-sigma factor